MLVMRVTLYKDLGSYHFSTHDINDVNYSHLLEGILYDKNYVPIGSISTEEDLSREERDWIEEFG